ncbi:MAG: MFS transporter [Chloroflexota bacterium]|nr:MFS transporter [Chloroflexota bacterium]
MAARAPLATLAALLLVRLADEWFSFFPAGLLEPIRHDTGLSYAQLGLILAAPNAGGLLGNAVIVAADYVDRRWISVAGAFAYALALAGFGVSRSLPLFLAWGILWGVASDAFVHGCELTLVDLYRAELPIILGRVNAYGSVGDLLGPLAIGVALSLTVTWRAIFLGGAALMLVYGVALLLSPFPSKERPILDDAPTVRQNISLLLRDRSLILMAVVDTLLGFLDEPFQGFLSAYLQNQRGVPPRLATAVLGVTIAAGLGGFLSMPAFAGRDPRRLLLGFAALTALGAVVVVAVPLLPVTFAAAALFGFSGAAFYSLLQTSYLSLHPESTGTTEAVVSTVGTFGIALPFVAGTVADHFGLTGGMAAFALAALAALALTALAVRPAERT